MNRLHQREHLKTTDFSLETMEARRQWNDILEELNLSTQISKPSENTLHECRKYRYTLNIDIPSDKGKTKRVCCSRPICQEMRKYVLSVGGK